MCRESDPFLLRRPQHTPLTGRRATLKLLNDNKQSDVELENFVLTMMVTINISFQSDTTIFFNAIPSDWLDMKIVATILVLVALPWIIMSVY